MFSLGPLAVAEGYRIEAHESVGSTNALALQRAVEGDPGKLWVVANEQTEGRGRRGRSWSTPRGNLAATLLVTGSFNAPTAATLGFVAGLSLGDALEQFHEKWTPVFRPEPPKLRSLDQSGVSMKRRDDLGATIVRANHSVGLGGGEARGGRFELKWPNDVLFDGKKLAGILLESSTMGDRLAVAIGIGVNVASHPENLPYPTTSLKEFDAGADAAALFQALSDAWIDNMRLWDHGRGMAATRERWLSRAAGLGGRVAVRVDGRIVQGIFETIDDSCRFIIREDDGSRLEIAAGDVHFGAVASLRD